MDPLALAPRGMSQGEEDGPDHPCVFQAPLSCVWDSIHREDHLKGGDRGTDGHLRAYPHLALHMTRVEVSGGNYTF